LKYSKNPDGQAPGFEPSAGAIIEMQLQQGDILIKTNKGRQVYWLSQRLLLSLREIDDGYLRFVRFSYKRSVSSCFQGNEFLPDSGKSWRYAKTKEGFYYCYDNIPDRAPTYYRSKLGTKQAIEKALKVLKVQSKAALTEGIRQGIAQQVLRTVKNQDKRYYLYKSAVVFSDKKAEQLAESLAWCRFMKTQYDNEGFKALGVRNKQEFLMQCTEILQSRGLEGLKVKSPAYLRNKLAKFPLYDEQAQREAIVSDKYANDNARVVGKYELFDEETGEVFDFDAHKALMFYGYMNPGRSGKEAQRQIYLNFYTKGIETFGFSPVAYRTFTHYMSALENRIKTARERHGSDYYKKVVQTYVPSKRLKYAHSLFAGDGSGTVNYRYTDKQGKMRIAKLYVMMISDVASRKIVGWSVSSKGGHEENAEMLIQAVKMAIKTCDYQTMFEFVSDNHSAFTAGISKQFLSLVFNEVRTIAVGNSQANPAETEFRLFKQSLRGLPNFITSSWQPSLEGKSNADYFKSEQLPSYEEAIIQFYDCVKKWNETPLRDGTTPNQRFGVKHPQCEAMDERIIRRIEGNYTQVDVSYMRGFVKVSKTKGYEYRDDYLFEIPDYWNTGAERISKALGYKKYGKVQVVWNAKVADLYTLEWAYIMSCKAAKKASQAYAESDASNFDALDYHNDRKEEQTKAIEAFEQSVQEVVDASLPYTHQMAAGGNKKTYNEAQILNEEQELTEKEKLRIKKARTDRDWKLLGFKDEGI